MSSPVQGGAVRITGGNINNSHIPVAHLIHLCPSDSIGGNNKDSASIPIEIALDGVGVFSTDIAGDKKILRTRQEGAVGKFYAINSASDGTRIFFEKTGPRSFRVSAIK